MNEFVSRFSSIQEAIGGESTDLFPHNEFSPEVWGDLQAEVFGRTEAFHLNHLEGGKLGNNALRRVWIETQGLRYGLMEHSLPVIDENGGFGMIFPNVNYETRGMGEGAKTAALAGKRVVNTMQRLMLYGAAMKHADQLNWPDFEASFGAGSFEVLRDMAIQTREVLGKQMIELAAAAAGVPVVKNEADAAQTVRRLSFGGATLPSAAIIDGQFMEAAARVKSGSSRRKVAAGCTMLATAGIVLSACGPAMAAKQPETKVPTPTDLQGIAETVVPNVGSTQAVGQEATPSATAAAPTEKPTEAATATATALPTEAATATSVPTEAATATEAKPALPERWDDPTIMAEVNKIVEENREEILRRFQEYQGSKSSGIGVTNSEIFGGNRPENECQRQFNVNRLLLIKTSEIDPPSPESGKTLVGYFAALDWSDKSTIRVLPLTLGTQSPDGKTFGDAGILTAHNSDQFLGKGEAPTSYRFASYDALIQFVSALPRFTRLNGAAFTYIYNKDSNSLVLDSTAKDIGRNWGIDFFIDGQWIASDTPAVEQLILAEGAEYVAALPPQIQDFINFVMSFQNIENVAKQSSVGLIPRYVGFIVNP